MTTIFKRSKYYVISVIGTIAVLSWLKYDMYQEYNDVINKLTNIQKIEIIKSGTLDEEFVVTNIFATVRTENNGILTFHGLDMDSFNSPDHLFVSRVGDWAIQTENYLPPSKPGGSPIRSSESGIDLMSDSVLLSLEKPYKINNLYDAIQQYDLILKYVESIPDFENKIIETNKDGEEQVTWRLKSDCMGTPSGWCAGMRMQCIKEWGDNYQWCK